MRVTSHDHDHAGQRDRLVQLLRKAALLGKECESWGRSGTSRDILPAWSHSSGDKAAIRGLYRRLRADGIDAWLDKENLLPGQDWDLEIRKAVRSSDVVLVCLSERATTKRGYLHREIRFALDLAEEQPEGTIFIIPVRLEPCNPPEYVASKQWVDLFEEGGHERLMRSLRARSQELGIG